MDSDSATSSQSDRAVQPLGYRAPLDEVSGRPEPTWGWSVLWRVVVYGGILAIFMLVFVPILGRRTIVHTGMMDCVVHVHQLMNHLVIHARANGGKYPPTLQAAQGSLSNSAFAKLISCPSSGGYLFPGAGLGTNLPRDTVIVYESPTSHPDAGGKTGATFGFANGTVVFLPATQAQKIIAELTAGHNPPRAEKIK